MNNPSLPDTQSFQCTIGKDVYPVLSNGGLSESDILVLCRTFALYSQAHSTTALDRFPPVPILCDLCVVVYFSCSSLLVFICSCEKYTDAFFVCQASSNACFLSKNPCLFFSLAPNPIPHPRQPHRLLHLVQRLLGLFSYP